MVKMGQEVIPNQDTLEDMIRPEEEVVQGAAVDRKETTVKVAVLITL